MLYSIGTARSTSIVNVYTPEPLPFRMGIGFHELNEPATKALSQLISSLSISTAKVTFCGFDFRKVPAVEAAADLLTAATEAAAATAHMLQRSVANDTMCMLVRSRRPQLQHARGPRVFDRQARCQLHAGRCRAGAALHTCFQCFQKNHM